MAHHGIVNTKLAQPTFREGSRADRRAQRDLTIDDVIAHLKTQQTAPPPPGPVFHVGSGASANDPTFHSSSGTAPVFTPGHAGGGGDTPWWAAPPGPVGAPDVISGGPPGRGDIPRDQGGLGGGFTGGPRGGMMDGRNTYDVSQGQGMGWRAGIGHVGDVIHNFQADHPVWSRIIGYGASHLVPLGGTLWSHSDDLARLASGENASQRGWDMWGNPDVPGSGTASAHFTTAVPVPRSVTSGGWDNTFRGEGADFWNSVQPDAGLGQQGPGLIGGMFHTAGGGFGLGGGGGREFTGSASPWSWGDEGGMSY